MLDVRRLMLLREVQARGSIAAVSRALGISSSAISQQLAKLESEVGMPLLAQAGRRVQLTDAGQHLAVQTDEIVTLLERAEADLERRRGSAQGIVRLAAFSTFALRYLPALVRRVERSFGHVVVTYAYADPAAALEAVAGRKADIAVIDEYGFIPHRVDASMMRFRLLRESITAYAPHRVRDFSEVAQLAWVLEPAGSDAATWARWVCRMAGFEPQVRFESPDLRVHHSLAATGIAAAFLPELLFSGPESAERPAHAIPWPNTGTTELSRDIYAVWRRGSQLRPAVAAVLDELKQVCDAGTGG